MRTLKLRFPDDALPTLDTFVKHTKDARVFRRAQAVRNVVKGQRLQTVSDTLQFTYSALRKWVYQQNPQSARRNNFPGEQISRRFLLLSENLSASNYPGAAGDACGPPAPPQCIHPTGLGE